MAHIAAGVALLGSSSGLVLTAARAATRDDPAEAHTLYELMRILTFSLAIPFSFIALASGAALALGTRWGLLRHWWVVAKLALLVATLATGALLTGPTIDTMVDATAPGGAGDSAAEKRLVVSIAAQGTMVLAALGLAVVKPWGRMRRSAPQR